MNGLKIDTELIEYLMDALRHCHSREMVLKITPKGIKEYQLTSL